MSGYGQPPQGGFAPPPQGFGPPPQHPGFGPPPQGFGPPPAAGPPQYEFTNLENETIIDTARWARYLAIGLFVSGGVSAIGCSFLNVLGCIAVAIPVLIAGNAFQRVVDTRGRDVTNMMEAVQTLGTSFLVRIIVMIVSIVLVLALVVLAVLFIGAIAAAIGGGFR